MAKEGKQVRTKSLKVPENERKNICTCIRLERRFIDPIVKLAVEGFKGVHFKLFASVDQKSEIR